MFTNCCINITHGGVLMAPMPGHVCCWSWSFGDVMKRVYSEGASFASPGAVSEQHYTSALHICTKVHNQMLTPPDGQSKVSIWPQGCKWQRKYPATTSWKNIRCKKISIRAEIFSYWINRIDEGSINQFNTWANDANICRPSFFLGLWGWNWDGRWSNGFAILKMFAWVVRRCWPPG